MASWANQNWLGVPLVALPQKLCIKEKAAFPLITIAGEPLEASCAVDPLTDLVQPLKLVAVLEV
jgi:hypothetical protein